MAAPPEIGTTGRHHCVNIGRIVERADSSLTYCKDCKIWLLNETYLEFRLMNKKVETNHINQ